MQSGVTSSSDTFSSLHANNGASNPDQNPIGDGDSSPAKINEQATQSAASSASQVVINLTSPAGNDESLQRGECSRRASRIVPEVMLMHSSMQLLPMKDFDAEVRAAMDVDQFLQHTELLLDISEDSFEGIVDRMLRKVSRKKGFLIRANRSFSFFRC